MSESSAGARPTTAKKDDVGRLRTTVPQRRERRQRGAARSESRSRRRCGMNCGSPGGKQAVVCLMRPMPIPRQEDDRGITRAISHQLYVNAHVVNIRSEPYLI